MKILSLHISSFGKLQNLNLNFADGVNILSQSNGYGKTTLAAFIRAMLYGFKYNSTKLRSSERVTDVGRWITWNSREKIGGSIKVEQKGEIIVIERYFGTKSAQETLSVTLQNSGKTLDLQTSVGEWLLGLTAESFDRSAYFPQESVEISTNENFDTRLAGLVQNAEDFSKVMKTLDDYRKDLKLQRGNGGLIYDLENKKMRLESQIFECTSAQKRQKEIETSLAQIAAQKAELMSAMARQNEKSEQLQKQFAQAQPTPKQLENAEKLRILREKTSRLRGLEADYKVCEQISEEIKSTSQATAKKSFSTILFVIGLLVIAAGVGLSFWQRYVGIGVAAAGVICAIVSFFVHPSVKKVNTNASDALVAQYMALAQKYIFCKDLSYDEVQKKMSQLFTEYSFDCRERDALADAMPTQPQVDVAALRAQLEEIKAKIASYQQQLQQLSRQEGSLATERATLNTDSLPLREQAEEAQSQIDAAKHQLDVIQKVTDLLLLAKQNLSTSYVPKLAARCEQLLNSVTAGNYQVVLDRNFIIKLGQNGVTKSLEFYSRGMREITFLCFRIALSEMLFGGKIPLLIIDDAFVNFDEENFWRATSLLRQMSADTQILYFTCHNRLGAMK